MIRTGEQYRAFLRKGRDIVLDGEPVADVTTHPVFKPLVDARARLFDLQHAPKTRDVLSLDDGGERQTISNKLPLTKQDWWDKRRAADVQQAAAGGGVGLQGGEVAGEMWSLFDGQDVLNDIDPTYSANLRTHIHRVLHDDMFMVCAASRQAPSGDADMAGTGAVRADTDAAQDVAVTVVGESDAGLLVSGIVRHPALAFAERAYIRPASTAWAPDTVSAQAVGFVCDLDMPGLRFACQSPAGIRGDAAPAPWGRLLNAVCTSLIFDRTLIPWENVLFYRHTRAAMFVRATQGRYAAFARLQRSLGLADMLLGAGVLAARMAGQAPHATAVASPTHHALTQLAAYRDGIQAHLTAAITLAERSPAGLMMPQQSLLYAGRAWAGTQLAQAVPHLQSLCAPLRPASRDKAGSPTPTVPHDATPTPTVPHDATPTPTMPHDATPTPPADASSAVTGEIQDRLLAYVDGLLQSDDVTSLLAPGAREGGSGACALAALYRHVDWDTPAAKVARFAGVADATAPGDAAASRTATPWLRRE